MKVSIEISFECPTWLKKAVRVAVPVGVFTFASVAFAGVPNTFTSGETLTAADLNANFTALDGRVTTLEAAPPILSLGSAAGEAGVTSTDTVYTHADLQVAAGTWLVFGNAVLEESFPDDCALGLYDVTAGATIPGSVGAPQAVQAGTAAQVGFTMSHVVTLAAPTTLRLVAWRNGASIVSFSDLTGTPAAAILPHKLEAVQLR